MYSKINSQTRKRILHCHTVLYYVRSFKYVTHRQVCLKSIANALILMRLVQIWRNTLPVKLFFSWILLYKFSVHHNSMSWIITIAISGHDTLPRLISRKNWFTNNVSNEFVQVIRGFFTKSRTTLLTMFVQHAFSAKPNMNTKVIWYECDWSCYSWALCIKFFWSHCQKITAEWWYNEMRGRCSLAYYKSKFTFSNRTFMVSMISSKHIIARRKCLLMVENEVYSTIINEDQWACSIY